MLQIIALTISNLVTLAGLDYLSIHLTIHEEVIFTGFKNILIRFEGLVGFF